jgi:hypothetical protein
MPIASAGHTLVAIGAKMLAYLRLQNLIEDRFDQLAECRRLLEKLWNCGAG